MGSITYECAFFTGSGSWQKEGMGTRSLDLTVGYTLNCSRDASVGFYSLCQKSLVVLPGRAFRCLSGERLSTVKIRSSMVGLDKKYGKLWEDLLADPSQWWDNRIGKPGPRFPDFKHKQTGEGLWVINKNNPPWVASEIAAIAPGVSIFSWAQSLSKYNKAGQFEKSLELFEQMQKEGITIDGYIFVHVLNACAALKRLRQGRQIHQLIIETGCELNVYVANSLVDMYCKCGRIDDARRVFDKIPRHDVVGWNAMITGSVKCGQALKALELFHQMQQCGVEPDPVTFVVLINACANISNLDDGIEIHEQIIRSGCECDVHVGSSLTDMYTKCGSIDAAWKVFHKMSTRNVVVWTAMILGCVKCGQGLKALELYQQMQREGVEPNSVTFVGLINACASIAGLEEGRGIHKQILQSGCGSESYVGSSLVDMYSKCESIDEAWRVFEQMPTLVAGDWNAMILGFVRSGQGLKALHLFEKMVVERVDPDSVTFAGLLNACASLGRLEEGKRVHKQVIRSGCELDVYVGSSLVDMYCKCGSINEAWRVFEQIPKLDVVGWNAMILGFVKCGQGWKALKLFQEMQHNGVDPNSVSFVGSLNACASMEWLEEGRQIHKQIVQCECECDIYVGSSLVDMYAKCGSIDEAWKVFHRMPTLDVVGWNAMILGSVKCGRGLKALELFQQMHQNGAEPDNVTFVGALNACAGVAALEMGKRIHRQIIDTGFESDVYVSTSLVNMYAKCGSLEHSERCFNKMPARNVSLWTAMLMGYAIHGHVKGAVALFEQMYQAGLEINQITFICLLSACSYGGLVKEGMQYFHSMKPVYNVSPTVEHYLCMINILGRAGHLNDAEELIKTMPFEPSAAAWMALLAASKFHGNVEIGERATRRVLELEPESASGYVLLSNIYPAAGTWDSKALFHDQRQKQGVKKETGRAWIEVNDEVHSFEMNDRQHHQIVKIHEELTMLAEHMKESGYVPDVKPAIHDIGDGEKVAHVHGHGEMLAIAFGLISTPAGAPLRIVKNVQVCGDCHTATKFISKLVAREISIRDGNRFHLFKDGLCSCGDFW